MSKIRTNDAMMRVDIVYKNDDTGEIIDKGIALEFWVRNNQLHPSTRKPIRIVIKDTNEYLTLNHRETLVPWLERPIRKVLGTPKKEEL